MSIQTKIYDLHSHSAIQLAWKEPGIAFRVSFVKSNYKQQLELQQELQQESLYSKVLQIAASKTSSAKDIAMVLGQKNISGQLYQVINKLREDQLIAWTIPDKPKSFKQQYKITTRGHVFLRILKNKKTK